MENNKNSNLPKKDGRLFVYLKVKKPLEKDKMYYNISEDKKLLSLHDKIIKDESSKTQIIEVDRIYDDSDDENKIYQEVCDNTIYNCLDYKNYTYISYGDSTSEKNELIIGNDNNGKKGIYFLLLDDLYNKRKHSSDLEIYLSFLMVNGSILIDLSDLMQKKKNMDFFNEKDLINKYGKEININDTNIIGTVKKIHCDTVEESYKSITNLFYSFKKMEETEGIRFISCSYFCFIIYIYNKKNNRPISTINFIIIPGNELLTTKVTNPHNAKRDNITNTKNIVELSYTIEDVIRHLSTQSTTEKSDTENMNKSKFMAVIGKVAFDIGNLDAQFDRRYRIIGSIYANTGLYYNTKDTLYFLFRCKKITRQKFNLEIALSLLDHEKRKQSKLYGRNSFDKENLIVNSKNEMEEKLKIKDDQIYDLESKLKLQETKVAELNTRIEKKDVNLKTIRNNYKMQIECLKESMGFKGDVNILLSKDQYTKEYRYALNLRNTVKTNKKKAEMIAQLEEKIKELNKEKARLKELLENKTKEKKILRIINSKDIKTDEESEENEDKIFNKNKRIQELQKKNEELEKQLESYNQEHNSKISLMHNLPKVIETNIMKLKKESTKNKETNEINKTKFIEEAKNINIKSEQERKKIIEKYENSIKQNKKEISNQSKIIREFEQKYEKEKNKCIDELLRLHKNLVNITYGYKNAFNDLNPKFLSQNKNSSMTNATNIIYMQKDDFEKVLENEIKSINKNQYPLLFEHLKKKGENILDIIDKNNNINNKEEILTMTKSSDISEFPEEKKLFKFFDSHEKKTEIEIENMNKNQLIHYSKQFLNRANEIEEYLNKYIQYKKGYKLTEEEEIKISDCNRKLEKSNEMLEDIKEKYNNSRIYLQKNNQIIEQLKKENISLKKQLNNILFMEKLTNSNYKTNTKGFNKKNYKDLMLDYEAQLTFNKNLEKNTINFDKEYRHTFTNFAYKPKNNKYDLRANTYSNANNKKNHVKITFNNTQKNRPFSSFQNIKTFKNK